MSCIIFTVSGYSWATDSVKMVAFSAAQNEDTSAIEVVDYESYFPAVNVSLHDFYGQKVVTESEGFVQLSVPANSQRQDCGKDYYGNIGGGIVEGFVEGMATFAEMDAFCVPGGVMFINAISDLVLNNTEIEVRFRSCVIGGESKSALR